MSLYCGIWGGHFLHPGSAGRLVRHWGRGSNRDPESLCLRLMTPLITKDQAWSLASSTLSCRYSVSIVLAQERFDIFNFGACSPGGGRGMPDVRPGGGGVVGDRFCIENVQEHMRVSRRGRGQGEQSGGCLRRRWAILLGGGSLFYFFWGPETSPVSRCWINAQSVFPLMFWTVNCRQQTFGTPCPLARFIWIGNMQSMILCT